MPAFDYDSTTDRWTPAPIAAGPFTGLQGGAVAGLLAGEVEAEGARSGWGRAVSASAHFLRPTPLAELRTERVVLRRGGRAALVDNAAFVGDESEPTAIARVMFLKERPVDIAGWDPPARDDIDPGEYPQHRSGAIHGGPWFMDAMDVHGRSDDSTTWFRVHTPVLADAGPLARVLGPADWAHGLARPVHDAAADPNPTLHLSLFREPIDDWIGVRAETNWEPDVDIGSAHGVLYDRSGQIGVVTMSIALVPFPSVN